MPEPRPATLPGAHEYSLHSPAIGTTFLITVSEPRKVHVGGPLLPPDPNRTKRPVIYVLDGNAFFPTVESIARNLQSGGEMPASIIVGIGYDDVNLPWGPMRLRMRDLAPTPNSTPLPAVRAPEGVSMEMPEGGGAPALLDFITGSVKPFVEANYSADPTDSTLVGYSLGGLFALYTLFHRPGAFTRYLAGSPSIWWDDCRATRYEEEFAANHADLPARVFMSIGSREEEPEEAKPARMVQNMLAMTESLRSRNYPGLHLTSHVFEDETHASGMFTAYARGLRVLFEPPPGIAT